MSFQRWKRVRIKRDDSEFVSFLFDRIISSCKQKWNIVNFFSQFYFNVLRHIPLKPFKVSTKIFFDSVLKTAFDSKQLNTRNMVEQKHKNSELILPTSRHFIVEISFYILASNIILYFIVWIIRRKNTFYRLYFFV